LAYRHGACLPEYLETYMHTGSCLCGAIAFEIATPIKRVTHCHCSKCRKAHGAAFASYAAIPVRALRYHRGQAELTSFQSSEQVERHFCRRCGATLFWSDSTRFKDWISVAVGCLDTPLPSITQQHAYVWSKATWHTIADRYVQHRHGAPQRIRPHLQE
jgi:hypothetical protein